MRVKVVYFVRSGDAFKIGIATDVIQRLRSLESANASDLEVLAAVPGGAELEAALHERFKAQRIRGEWFRYDEDLRDHIAELQKSGGMVVMAPKRGYSREFTPRSERRIKIEIDRVPPTLAAALKAKAKRDGISIRALTLQLWTDWLTGSTRGGSST